MKKEEEKDKFNLFFISSLGMNWYKMKNKNKNEKRRRKRQIQFIYLSRLWEWIDTKWAAAATATQ